MKHAMKLGAFAGSFALSFALGCSGSTTNDNGGAADASGSSSDASHDASTSTPDATTTNNDSGLPGTPGTGSVTCGSSTCNAPAEVCCVGTGGQPSCVAAGQCQGASLTCSSASNCSNGDVCCATFGAGGASSSCESACSGLSVQLCTDDSECKGTKCTAGIGGTKYCGNGFGGFDGGFPGQDGGIPGLDGGVPFDTGLGD